MGSASRRLRGVWSAKAASDSSSRRPQRPRELRIVAPGVDIYVLEGARAGEVETLAAARATPVLCSLEQVERWAGRGRALLQIDTGMARLGLTLARGR